MTLRERVADSVYFALALFGTAVVIVSLVVMMIGCHIKETRYDFAGVPDGTNCAAMHESQRGYYPPQVCVGAGRSYTCVYAGIGETADEVIVQYQCAPNVAPPQYPEAP